MNHDSANAGSKPSIIPLIADGSFPINDKKGIISLSLSMFVRPPKKADGIDQKMTAAVMTAIMKNRRMINSHHRILSVLQMISLGRSPMCRGDICNGK